METLHFKACELWLTIGTERFWQISAGPHLSSLDHIFRCDPDIGTQYVAYERESIHMVQSAYL